MSPTSTRRRSARLAVALLAVAGLLWTFLPTPAGATGAAINGQGSSYVALAMQQWVANAQTSGLKVNYTPSGSPAGLTSFGQNQVDFAGTEAEYSALGSTEPNRGYQYVPDVAGAVAIMYNAQDGAGKKVDYLRLSRLTVARIFMGDICKWSDPAISADNVGLVLPDQTINVVYRGGQSGTTALFYDFVAHTAPDIFRAWAAKNQFPTDRRIIQLDSSPSFACKTQAFQGSDQIAQNIGSAGGLWSIGYDEFGFAQTYHVPAARVQNAHGDWILPYAQNISSALESAKLRPDLSQELADVYNSPNSDAYPISAYSYLVTQCAPAADRPTCKGAYSNPGVTETLAAWMRYIACEGQVSMADIGYSPLPKELSQEIANSIARMKGGGTPAEQLTADNCANPRFRGAIPGPKQPEDPLAKVKSLAPGANASSTAGPASSSAAATGTESAAATTGAVGAVKAAGGGSTDWRTASPTSYDRPGNSTSVLVPLLVLLAILFPR